jgi:hypothetical protein
MKILFTYMLMLALVAVSGCDGGSDKVAAVGGEADPALVGRWIMTLMSVDSGPDFSPATIEWDFQIELTDTGRFSYQEVWRGSTDSDSGTWGTTDNQLMMRTSYYDWSGTYAVEGNTFRFSNVPNYDGQGHLGSFTFTRM